MPRPLPPRVTLLAVLPLAIGLAACGPSFQAIYEGNARFEHCYALEENPHAPMPKKAACWRDWSERYTYGQTRDRVHYATARYVALSQAPTLPTDEALMMAAPGEAPRLSTITAPAPTNAYAPPPKTLDPEDHVSAATHGEAAHIPVIGVDAGGALPVHAPALPAAGCAESCGSTYRGCSGGCDGADGQAEGQKAAKSCQACLKTYRTCMRACFK